VWICSCYLRLVQGGAITKGVVVRTDRNNHCLAEYAFTVDDREYRGAGPDCSVRVGAPVTITYLLGHAEHSCLGVARDRLNNELATFVAGAVFLPPFAMYVWGRRQKASEGRAAQQGWSPQSLVHA
jgi:hypothetical protein